MRWQLNIHTRLLKQVFIIKVLNESFMLRIVWVNDRLKVLSTLIQSHPFSLSFLKFVLDRNSLVIVPVVYQHTVITEELLGVVCTCVNLTVPKLFVSSCAVAFDIIRSCKIIEEWDSELWIGHALKCWSLWIRRALFNY